MDRAPEGDEAPPRDEFGAPDATDEALMGEETATLDGDETLIDGEGEDVEQAEKPPWIITWPLHLEPEEFDQLVSAVMDELPEEWGLILDKMTIVVDEEPDADERPEEGEIFGLYRGSFVAAQFLGGGLAGPAMAAPPEIALFQGPLERASADLDDLRERVRATLVGQIGHHFGYEDEDDDESADDAEEWQDHEDDEAPGDVVEE